jgi:hypothetical protein
MGLYRTLKSMTSETNMDVWAITRSLWCILNSAALDCGANSLKFTDVSGRLVGPTIWICFLFTWRRFRYIWKNSTGFIYLWIRTSCTIHAFVCRVAGKSWIAVRAAGIWVAIQHEHLQNTSTRFNMVLRPVFIKFFVLSLQCLQKFRAGTSN